GLGTLTGALLQAGAEVWAVELDLKLHAHLQRTLLEQYPAQLHLMQGDAVEHPIAGLRPTGEYKVVANLPYAISTPWLEGLLEQRLPSRMVLMLQKEAADRYLASPGGKEFGAISIFLQAAFERQPGHRVSRACFYPAPDVDSTLLHLPRKEQPRLFAAETRGQIRRIFQQRRKQLRALCKGQPALEAWFQAGLAAGEYTESVRPEDVPLDSWM